MVAVAWRGVLKPEGENGRLEEGVGRGRSRCVTPGYAGRRLAAEYKARREV